MRIHCGFEIIFDCPRPIPMLLMLSVHPSRRDDLETPDWLKTEPVLDVRQYLDHYGNICSRIVVPAGRVSLSADFTIHDDGRIDDLAPDAIETPFEQLPDEVMIYLLGSRYCETDRLMDVAWSLFSATPPGWTRVQAIMDYVHRHIRFGYEFARPTKGAFEAYQEATGVCRDYAHLAIAFCRCMNIPARYCTGYLGDIWVPVVGVMDFSAWCEVYLDGRWYVFDPRNNIRRVGRVLMARGRDATDVPLSNTFGEALLSGFKVVSDELVAA